MKEHPNPLVHRSTQAQRILDGLLASAQSERIWQKLRWRWLCRRRRQAIAAGDPLVEYRLKGTPLLLPLSHDLPFHCLAAPFYSTNVARIGKAVLGKYRDLAFVDIGANVGDTVALLRHEAHYPVLCIEGDARFFSILQRNIERLELDLELEKAFVTATGALPGEYMSERGTGRIVVDSPSSPKHVAKTLLKVLEDHPRFCRAKMFKVDTDGMDCAILRSALDLFTATRPVLFFEYDPHFIKLSGDDGFSIFRGLRAAGYRTAMVYDNAGEYLLTENLDCDSVLYDIHQYFSGRSGGRYCDICVFHEEDLDLAQSLRSAEIAFFAQHRR